MYIYTPLCRYWKTLYRYVLVFIMPHTDIELEDNKQFISNIPHKLTYEPKSSGELKKKTTKKNNVTTKVVYPRLHYSVMLYGV